MIVVALFPFTFYAICIPCGQYSMVHMRHMLAACIRSVTLLCEDSSRLARWKSALTNEGMSLLPACLVFA